MFCPKCGNADQQPEAFCRQCGAFLPDFDKLKSREIPPEQHFIANITFNAMTAVASLGLAITLYVMFLGKEGTPFVIYLTAGFLTAIFFWQVQIFWRTVQLKKQFPGLNRKAETEAQNVESATTRKLLDEADLSVVIPVRIAEPTPTKLGEKNPTIANQI
jgi:hypothetical protein